MENDPRREAVCTRCDMPSAPTFADLIVGGPIDIAGNLSAARFVATISQPQDCKD